MDYPKSIHNSYHSLIVYGWAWPLSILRAALQGGPIGLDLMDTLICPVHFVRHGLHKANSIFVDSGRF